MVENQKLRKGGEKKKGGGKGGTGKRKTRGSRIEVGLN